MATIKIKYDVDKSELDKSNKDLVEAKKNAGLLDDEVQKTNKSLKDTSKETGNVNKSFGDLKSTLAKVGIAALAFEGARAFVQLNKEVIQNRKEVALLTRETGIALDQITAKVRATSQTFNKDFNETLRAANAFSKEFGIGLTDALDQINEGFIQGADINGEYLQTLSEYSSQVKSAGLNQKEFIELITTSVQEGIFSDKGIDVVKEAALRIRELTPATSSALDNIGLASKQIEEDLRTGAKSIFDVIKDVSKRLDELPPQSKEVGTAIADIFGGPGEDAGLRFITLLQNVDGEMEAATGSAARYADQQRRLLGAQEDLNTELVKFSENWDNLGPVLETFITNVGAGALRFINDFASAFIDADIAMETFRKNLNSFTVEQVKSQIAELESELKSVEGGFERNISIAEGLAEIFGAKITKSVDDASERLQLLRDRLRQLESGEAVVETEVQKTNTALNNQAKAADRVKDSVDKLIAITPGLSGFEQGLVKFTENLFGGDLEGQVDKLKSAVDKAISIRAEAAFKQDEQDQENAERQRELREDIAAGTIDSAVMVNDFLAEQERERLEQRLANLEAAYQTELALAGNNAAAKEKVEEEYNNQRKQLLREQARQEKRQRTFQALINVATAITAALTAGPIVGQVLAGITAALGAIQVAAIQSQPLPQFNKGTKRVPGTDTTKDSVHALLTPGEGVMPVQQMNMYRPAFEAMFDKKIDPDVINGIAQGKLSHREYHRETIRDSVNIHIDKKGFGLNTRKNLSNYQRQIRDYSMHG